MRAFVAATDKEWYQFLPETARDRAPGGQGCAALAGAERRGVR